MAQEALRGEAGVVDGKRCTLRPVPVGAGSGGAAAAAGKPEASAALQDSVNGDCA